MTDIMGVTVYARCKGSGFYPFAGAAKIALKTHGVVYESNYINLGWDLVWRDYSNQWATNPFTGVKWTQEEINALQIGISLLGSWLSGYKADSYCTQLYAVVDYIGGQKILRPDAPGDECHITDQAGPSCPAHWQNVDEESPDDNYTYVHAGNIPDQGWSRDLYNIPVLVAPPTVTTDPATAIASDTATLNGTLDADGGEACACGFQWGETIAYGNTTPTQSKTTGQTFAQTITGLDPNKTYHFRAFATNAAGTSYGADRTFTTLVALPAVTTDPATELGTIAATLNGTLDDDGGELCDCGFEWGLTESYGKITPAQGKTAGEHFSQLLTRLEPDTVYHFRALASNVFGLSHGIDGAFRTLSPMPPPYFQSPLISLLEEDTL